MAIFTPSSLVSEIRGSVGEQTFSRNGSGIYVMSKLTQTNPDTPAQQVRREAVAEAVTAWQSLSDAEAQQWIAFAKSNRLKNRLGVNYTRSGFNEFVNRYVNRSLVSSSASGFAPLPRVRVRPLEVTTNLSPGSMEVAWHLSNDGNNTFVVVYATRPLSPGIRFINPSFLRVIAVLENSDQNDLLDIYAEYVALFSPTDLDNGSRIGFAVKVVNSDNFAESTKFFLSDIATNVFPGSTPAGINWTIRTSAADNSWLSVAFGAGVFVAVSSTGTGNRVMSSPDGITWTIRTSAADNVWTSVAFGAGLFVAVSANGSGNRVMTSPDGITWTIQTSAADNVWQSVTYGAGLFVAVSNTGSGNRVMTSPDGITWTIQTSAADNGWSAVTFGSGLFVAVSTSGSGNRVMTSPDGVTWTIQTSAADNSWAAICFGSGLFVATSISGSGDRVMTSPDGVTWTIRTSPADNQWGGVVWTGSLFVSVSRDGSGNRVMTSPDGVTWTIRTSAADNTWRAVAWNGSLLVAVAASGTGNRVMTSS